MQGSRVEAYSLLPRVVELAVAAGESILRHYGREVHEAKLKPDQSPLTCADLEAEAIILEGLRALDPSSPYISEESPIPDFEVRRSWERFWLVDPLDGTKEFLKRTGEFTVNIALVERGEPLLGVVYAPARGICYYAQKGGGAWKRGPGGETRRVYSRPPAFDSGVTVVDSVSHPSAETERFLRGLRVKERIQIGSSLKFCLVAEGRAEIYPRFGPTMEWDTAAGDCVFRNSGREGLRRSPLTYNKPALLNEGFVIGMDGVPAAGLDPSHEK